MPDLFIDDIDDAVLARIEALAKSRGIAAKELVLEAITEMADDWPAARPEAEPAHLMAKTDSAA